MMRRLGGVSGRGQMLAALIVVLMLSVVAPARAADPALPVPGLAAGGARAVMLMPFDVGGTTGDTPPPAHGTQSGSTATGFAWDLHQAMGTGVRARFDSLDGVVTIRRVGSVGFNQNGAGRIVRIEVRVNGTPVGTVFFQHLSNVPEAALQAGVDYPSGTLLGYLPTGTYPSAPCTGRGGNSYGWQFSTSWMVCSPAGVHTHVDVAQGCYRTFPAGTWVGPNTPILMLSSALRSTNKSPCDNAEVAQVYAAPLTWQETPRVEGGILEEVSCTSPTFCMAIGEAEGRADSAWRWDGSSWVPSGPLGSTPNSWLTAVSCTSPSNCFAVGSHHNPTRGQVETLVVHWNGAAWSVMPSPNLDLDINRFTGVSCASSSFCVAVGEARNYGIVDHIGTVIQHFDGTTWRIMPSPATGHFYDPLIGIACVTATSCFAVGQSYIGEFGPYLGLIEHWNGTEWTATQTATPELLTGIACASTTDCGAVGGQAAYHWDGATWVSEAFPSPEGSSGWGLSAVDCPARSTCFGVGAYWTNFNSDVHTLVMQRGPSGWRQTSGLNLPSGGQLRGVSCPSTRFCMAVGQKGSEALAAIGTPAD